MEPQRLSQRARLIRREGVYYYRRRVPDALVAVIDRREIHHSLATASLAEAKKRRILEDLRWDARFQAAGPTDTAASSLAAPVTVADLSEAGVLRLVQVYVADLDQQVRRDALESPPHSDEQRDVMRENIEVGLSILQSRYDPRGVSHPLHGEAISLIVKKRVAAVGLDPTLFSGHSLRAGFVTSAILAGADGSLIARQTGHRSQQSLAAYVRPKEGVCLPPVGGG